MQPRQVHSCPDTSKAQLKQNFSPGFDYEQSNDGIIFALNSESPDFD